MGFFPFLQLNSHGLVASEIFTVVRFPRENYSDETRAKKCKFRIHLLQFYGHLVKHTAKLRLDPLHSDRTWEPTRQQKKTTTLSLFLCFSKLFMHRGGFVAPPSNIMPCQRHHLGVLLLLLPFMLMQKPGQNFSKSAKVHQVGHTNRKQKGGGGGKTIPPGRRRVSSR